MKFIFSDFLITLDSNGNHTVQQAKKFKVTVSVKYHYIIGVLKT